MPRFLSFFFFNDTATTEIYTLSLHDALPIFGEVQSPRHAGQRADQAAQNDEWIEPALKVDDEQEVNEGDGHHETDTEAEDRKSTRLNSSHANISYAVFCLKKKKKKTNHVVNT